MKPTSAVGPRKLAPTRRRPPPLVELLESARGELATEHPEQYKIFLLGAMAGLRRNEIDVLPWTAFHWNEGLIRIETTKHYRPKSHNSEGDVAWILSSWSFSADTMRGEKVALSLRAIHRRRPSMRPMGFTAA